MLLGLLIVATLIAGMWAISRLVSLRRQRRGYNNPWRLFWALCQGAPPELVRKLAVAAGGTRPGLHDPGRLFLEAQLWDEKVLGPRFALENPRLQALRKQIFARGEAQRGNEAAREAARPPSLFPSLPSPTLDIPPWTAERT